MQQRNEFWQTPVHESSLSQADVLNRLIDEAEAVVVGIGAGMSAATGFTYVGKRFTTRFLILLKISLLRYVAGKSF